MDKYLDSFRKMISLRGLTDHILKNYCTYIRAYLDYLTNILHKSPEDVSENPKVWIFATHSIGFCLFSSSVTPSALRI